MHKPFGVVNQYHPYIKCPISLHILSPLSFLTLKKSISLSVLQNFSKIPHDNHSFPFLKPKFYHVKFSLFSQFIIYQYLQIHLVLNFFTQTLTIYLILKKKKNCFFLFDDRETLQGKGPLDRPLSSKPQMHNPICKNCASDNIGTQFKLTMWAT